ncbi:MAG: HD domain-containing protein [Candidatus ainarchaeum sp.]|nr:HD domain-containing protein [Candidatus ainarchaeum sp.]
MLIYTKRTRPPADGNARGVSLLQAAMFWPQNMDGAIYRSLVTFHANRELRREADAREGKGLGALVQAAHRRLIGMENGGGRDTNKHSREAATLAGAIINEGIQRDLPETRGVDPKCIFAGGYVHDVGKTVLPRALLSKEGGIEIFGLRLLLGVKLTIVERCTLRHEHIRLGSEIGKIYWNRDDDTSLIIAQDMIGLHHVTYNGQDGSYPSYPLGKRGMDLPFHCRIAKTADFVSAVLPRKYRPVYQQQWITAVDEAVGYAIMMAGTELDPLTVSCLLTAMYDIKPGEADALVERLRYSGDQKGLLDTDIVKGHVLNYICGDNEFIRVMKKRSHAKIAAYTSKMCDWATGFGIEIAPDFPLTAEYIKSTKTGQFRVPKEPVQE